MAIATINPTTGEVIKTFTADSPETVNAKLALAQKAF